MNKKAGNRLPAGQGRNKPVSGQISKQYQQKIHVIENPRILALLIIVLTCLAFYPSMKNDFIFTWDDNAYVTANPIVQSLNLQSLKHMFTKQVNGTYVPLPLLTYSIEYTLFGIHPLPYHITNLIIHLLCTLLVFQLFRLLKINIFYAAAGAVLFGIHPMRVESVAWIAERKDVLYSLFYMAALVTHVKFVLACDQGKKFYRLTILFFILALLSKIEAVTLPLSLLLIDYFMDRPLRTKLILEKIPHFLLSLLFGCLGIFILYRVGLLYVNKELNFTARLFYGLFSLNVYILKFLVPYLQSAVYPYPVPPGNALPLIYYLNPLLTVGIAFLVYKTAHLTRAVVFGSLLFFVNVIFMLQILAAGKAFLSDRYTYIAYTGLIFILVWSLEHLVTKKKKLKQVVMIGMTAYMIIFIVMTYKRCEIWKNGETLWTDVIKKYHDQVIVAYSNRGIFYTNLGQWDNAIADLTMAISIDPKYPVSYANRGLIYANLGQQEKAIADFSSALAIDPHYTLVFHNRGVAFGNTGQYMKAKSDFLRAIKLDAKYSSAYSNLSFIYCQQNQLDSAVRICLAGLKMDPESTLLHSGLGRCYLIEGDIDNAVVQYKKCLETNDRNLDALLGMAVASFEKNEIAYAKGYISQAAMVEPALNEGMTGIEKLERAGYSFSEGEKDILSKLFSQMK
jgi:tetratricopeptide (TPR) repeat protein